MNWHILKLSTPYITKAAKVLWSSIISEFKLKIELYNSKPRDPRFLFGLFDLLIVSSFLFIHSFFEVFFDELDII